MKLLLVEDDRIVRIPVRDALRAAGYIVTECARSLAMRSKEAAQKTEELIRQSVREAGEGEATASSVSRKLVEIGGSITKVADIVAELAASAKEQAGGIEQVNKAVAQVGDVTQRNAANSEESSSAATELSGQSEDLAKLVGSFCLDVSAGEGAHLIERTSARENSSDDAFGRPRETNGDVFATASADPGIGAARDRARA